jgi:hypothetical protein
MNESSKPSQKHRQGQGEVELPRSLYAPSESFLFGIRRTLPYRTCVKTMWLKIKRRTLRDRLRVDTAYVLSVTNMEEATVRQQTAKNSIHRFTSRANGKDSFPFIL